MRTNIFSTQDEGRENAFSSSFTSYFFPRANLIPPEPQDQTLLGFRVPLHFHCILFSLSHWGKNRLQSVAKKKRETSRKKSPFAKLDQGQMGLEVFFGLLIACFETLLFRGLK